MANEKSRSGHYASVSASVLPQLDHKKGTGPRAAFTFCAAMKSASLTSAGCAGRLEMTRPSGRFHLCTLLCLRVTLPGSASSVPVRCRFHTWRPVYGGLAPQLPIVRDCVRVRGK